MGKSCALFDKGKGIPPVAAKKLFARKPIYIGFVHGLLSHAIEKTTY
jgi:hypothetical protein